MNDTLHRDLELMRPALVRFAMLQLHNAGAADDVVQDALVAVLEKQDRFAGQSSLRTYVTAILKNKIIDAMRASRRALPIDTGDGRSDAEVIDALFQADGHTVESPRNWDPDAALQEKDFFRVLETCLERLPANTARIFMMREWLELSTDEICKELGITPSNAWVMLYRARLQLRE
jgi:RNA polymerase sigma-70 factor (ECF subfamily)